MNVLPIRPETFDSPYQELQLSKLTFVSSYVLLVLGHAVGTFERQRRWPEATGISGELRVDCWTRADLMRWRAPHQGQFVASLGRPAASLAGSVDRGAWWPRSRTWRVSRAPGRSGTWLGPNCVCLVQLMQGEGVAVWARVSHPRDLTWCAFQHNFWVDPTMMWAGLGRRWLIESKACWIWSDRRWTVHGEKGDRGGRR